MQQKTGGREVILKVVCGKKDTFSTSLAAPHEGVRQNAEIGMRGVDLSEEEWEATYAGLRGPGSWPEAELQAHTRKLKKEKDCSNCCNGCWTILMVLMVLFGCWVYSIEHHIDAQQEYVITGAIMHVAVNGPYLRSASVECNGKPVFEAQDIYRGDLVLFSDPKLSWAVVERSDFEDCKSNGVPLLKSIGGLAGPAVLRAPVKPCTTAGKNYCNWQEEAENGEWKVSPNVFVDVQCPADDPCCGATACEQAPVLTEEYIITGASNPSINGVYVRLDRGQPVPCTVNNLDVAFIASGMSSCDNFIASGTWSCTQQLAPTGQHAHKCDRSCGFLCTENVCSELPVFKSVTSPVVLFKPTGSTNWIIGPSSSAAGCSLQAVQRWACSELEDRSCEGAWLEYDQDGHQWQQAPLLALEHRCPLPSIDPYCR